MNNYYCYEWQSISKDESREFNGSKVLKDLLTNNNLNETLKEYEIMLACTKVINDELDDEQYAEIENGKLPNVFDGNGKAVPKKYIKEFNNLI